MFKHGGMAVCSINTDCQSIEEEEETVKVVDVAQAQENKRKRVEN